VHFCIKSSAVNDAYTTLNWNMS